MGFFKRLRRLANPLKLNLRKPLNPAGFRRVPGSGGLFKGITPFRRPSQIFQNRGIVPPNRIGMNDEMNFSALGDNYQDTNFGPLNAGLSESDSSIWGNIGKLLGGAASKVIDAKAQAEVMKAQAQLYTPQNIELARRQAEFETAKAGGVSSTLLIGAGLAALALVMVLKKK